jgi:hypothetical protein
VGWGGGGWGGGEGAVGVVYCVSGENEGQGRVILISVHVVMFLVFFLLKNCYYCGFCYFGLFRGPVSRKSWQDMAMGC